MRFYADAFSRQLDLAVNGILAISAPTCPIITCVNFAKNCKSAIGGEDSPRFRGSPR